MPLSTALVVVSEDVLMKNRYEALAEERIWIANLERVRICNEERDELAYGRTLVYLKKSIQEQDEIIKKKIPGTIRIAQRMRKSLLQDLSNMKFNKMYVGIY